MSEISSEELIQLLTQLAARDLEDGASIRDHPCSVAIRRIQDLDEEADKWAEAYRQAKESAQRLQSQLAAKEAEIDMEWISEEEIYRDIQTIVCREPMREGEYPSYFNVGHDNVTRILRRPVYNCYNGDEFDVYKGKQIHATLTLSGVAEIYYKSPPPEQETD